jgi:hypothetical protein
LHEVLSAIIHLSTLSIVLSMKYKYGFGISLPKELVKKIDTERGDIPRSKYLLRILERTYNTTYSNNKYEVKRNQNQDLLDLGIEISDQANPVAHKESNSL